jgi:hypothetical protein
MPTDRDIWTRVEELREQFPSLRADHLPLDLITFVELELRLDIIPDIRSSGKRTSLQGASLCPQRCCRSDLTGCNPRLTLSSGGIHGSTTRICEVEPPRFWLPTSEFTARQSSSAWSGRASGRRHTDGIDGKTLQKVWLSPKTVSRGQAIYGGGTRRARIVTSRPSSNVPHPSLPGICF